MDGCQFSTQTVNNRIVNLPKNFKNIYKHSLCLTIQVKTLTGARSKYRLGGVAFRRLWARFRRTVLPALA
jgi:hypothetical protein